MRKEDFEYINAKTFKLTESAIERERANLLKQKESLETELEKAETEAKAQEIIAEYKLVFDRIVELDDSRKELYQNRRYSNNKVFRLSGILAGIAAVIAIVTIIHGSSSNQDKSAVIQATTVTQATTLAPTTTTATTTNTTTTTTTEPSTEEETEGAEDAKVQNYILNTNTHKIHYPGCSAVAKMNPKNKKEVKGNLDDFVEDGYKPCGICKPN